MDARLQRRVQRYGWDLAAPAYETLWQAQLAAAQAELLAQAALMPGEQVLDVACGTGLVSLAAAEAVAPAGRVTGVDLSEQMVACARQRAAQQGVSQATFVRGDAEALELPDACFDAVLCALGLMYLPDPARALREMRRVLRPGGRLVAAVWGERARCAWAPLFGIVDAEVASEVCPLFFGLGQGDALARLCRASGLQPVAERRLTTTLDYADGPEACAAAFAGGPVALAWSRFDVATRERACASYLDAIAPWRRDGGYALPAEFVVVTAAAG